MRQFSVCCTGVSRAERMAPRRIGLSFAALLWLPLLASRRLPVAAGERGRGAAADIAAGDGPSRLKQAAGRAGARNDRYRRAEGDPVSRSLPQQRRPRGAMVVVPGLTPHGKDDPRLVALSPGAWRGRSSWCWCRTSRTPGPEGQRRRQRQYRRRGRGTGGALRRQRRAQYWAGCDLLRIEEALLSFSVRLLRSVPYCCSRIAGVKVVGHHADPVERRRHLAVLERLDRRAVRRRPRRSAACRVRSPRRSAASSST